MNISKIDEIAVGPRWLFVSLSDGRIVVVRRDAFFRIDTATTAQLTHYELLADGSGVHWPEIDEDISIDGLMRRGLVVSPDGSLNGGT